MSFVRGYPSDGLEALSQPTKRESQPVKHHKPPVVRIDVEAGCHLSDARRIQQSDNPTDQETLKRFGRAHL